VASGVTLRTPRRAIPLAKQAITPPQNRLSKNEMPAKVVLLSRVKRSGGTLLGGSVATLHGCPGCKIINQLIDRIVDPP
jgi:hypothetical protein